MSDIQHGQKTSARARPFSLNNGTIDKMIPGQSPTQIAVWLILYVWRENSCCLSTSLSDEWSGVSGGLTTK